MESLMDIWNMLLEGYVENNISKDTIGNLIISGL